MSIHLLKLGLSHEIAWKWNNLGKWQAIRGVPQCAQD